MIIALDQAIPYWQEAFSGIGEIRPFAARDMTPENIRDADALIVRSVTPIQSPLLDRSSVRFVAAASAGVDHVDPDYLVKLGISFSYAAGCNANSVSEHILTALHVIAERKAWALKGKSLAVIGVGHVGSRVARKAEALGMEVLLCDPPLRDLTGDRQYLPFNKVLEADILTFHVPLTSEGPYPTRHLLDRHVLDRLTPGQFLINSSRGSVFDNRELKRALQEHRIAGVVLDVWEGEPRIDYALLDRVDIGTPHLAGTSLDGKIGATEMVRDALCRFFGTGSSVNMGALYPGPRHIRPAEGTSDQDAVLSVLRQAYDITANDGNLRALASLPENEAAERFERLRTGCALRPEFHHFIVELSGPHRNLAEIFTGLGFRL